VEDKRKISSKKVPEKRKKSGRKAEENVEENVV